MDIFLAYSKFTFTLALLIASVQINIRYIRNVHKRRPFFSEKTFRKEISFLWVFNLLMTFTWFVGLPEESRLFGTVRLRNT